MTVEQVLIWSVDPRAPTAYGQQCALLADALKAEGYKVAIGAMVSRAQDKGRPYHGMTVYDVRDGQHGATHLKAKLRRHMAQLLIVLCDSFMIDAHLIDEVTRDGYRVAYWCPVDGYNVRNGGLPILYRAMLTIAPRAVPIAMSRFGERAFRHDGFDPLYVPHMIDTDLFRPFASSFDSVDAVRGELRAAAGIDPDAFVITLCAANSDLVRKNFTGTFDAFGRAAQDDWLLLVHSDKNGHWDLEWLADYYGITDKVLFADRERYKNAGYTPADLAFWYNLGNLHTQMSMAEGFGIPLIEAQACGLPVVTTDGSAMSELCGSGRVIPGEPFMSPLIRAEWVNAPRQAIADAYTEACQMLREDQAVRWHKARAFAEQYGITQVIENYWLPAMKALEDR